MARAELRLLDQQAKALREELGYSQPGEVIWQARLDFDEMLVVVADGFGRASVLRVSGTISTPKELVAQCWAGRAMSPLAIWPALRRTLATLRDSWISVTSISPASVSS